MDAPVLVGEVRPNALGTILRLWERSIERRIPPGGDADHTSHVGRSRQGVVMGEDTGTRAADSAGTRQYILRAVLESPRDIVIFALDAEYRYLAFNEAHRRTIAAI